MSPLLQSAAAIGAEVAARLGTCTVAAGAETNLGARIYRGRTAIDDDLIPCCVVIEGADEVNEPEAGISVNVLQQYVLMAYVPCDPDHPNDAAHAALRDMKRAVFRTDGKADRTLGRKVQRVRYRGRDIGPRADGAAFVCAVLEVTVAYVENLSQP